MLMMMKKNMKIMRMKGSCQQNNITTMRKRMRMTMMMMTRLTLTSSTTTPGTHFLIAHIIV